MNEQPVNWFPDSAARFIELLQHHTWNESVTLLKAEKSNGVRELTDAVSQLDQSLGQLKSATALHN